MKIFFKIMFIIDMIFIGSVRHVDNIPFLNYPLLNSFQSLETILVSSWLKVTVLLMIVMLLQYFAIQILTYKAKKQKDKQDREIKNDTFFQNAEYLYIPSYLGINILAFSLSEKYQYLIVLIVFTVFLINTKIVFFSPWLKVFKNYRLYILNNANREELLILKGSNNEDNFNIKKLAQIDTDVLITTT